MTIFWGITYFNSLLVTTTKPLQCWYSILAQLYQTLLTNQRTYNNYFVPKCSTNFDVSHVNNNWCLQHVFSQHQCCHRLTAVLIYIISSWCTYIILPGERISPSGVDRATFPKPPDTLGVILWLYVPDLSHTWVKPSNYSFP